MAVYVAGKDVANYVTDTIDVQVLVTQNATQQRAIRRNVGDVERQEESRKRKFLEQKMELK